MPGFTTRVDRVGEQCLRIQVDGSQGKRSRKPERSVRILAGYGAGAQYGVHTDSLKNLCRGVVERVFHVVRSGVLATPPRPSQGVFNRLSDIRRRLLRKLCRTPIVSPADYPRLYAGRKQQVYQRAHDSLQQRALRRSDAYVSTFVKAEKVNFSAKGDPAPRVIQPRSPRYNLSVGRYLKLFEAELVRGFERVFGYKVITKGMNADGVGRTIAEHWGRFRAPCAVGLDASRFDQHVSVDALRFEHSIYNGVFQDPELARLLRWQLSNTGIARVEGYRVDYQVEGCRMSGDINTGMGNCLLMSSIVLAYTESVGLRCRLVNNGDDCVVICETADINKLDGIDQWFLDFGFTLTREQPVYVLEQVEFCQAQPVCIDGQYRMVRNPYTAMSKDCVSLLSWDTEAAYQAWIGAIGACGSALTTGVPVWSAWYAAMSRHGTDREHARAIVEDSGLGYMAAGVVAATMTEGARYSFWLAFGILPDVQVALEQHYSQADLSYTRVVPMTVPNVKTINRATNPIVKHEEQARQATVSSGGAC